VKFGEELGELNKGTVVGPGNSTGHE
jgi:hypothetical protein